MHHIELQRNSLPRHPGRADPRPDHREDPITAPAARAGEDAEFLTALVKQIRATRELRGVARKLSSQDAGVSQRYLAQF